jgi:hypothetical protein
MADTNLYKCTPRQMRGYIMDIFYAGLVPYVRSSPGMGKSSIFRSISDELNLKMIDHRLSTSDPTDLSGLPQFVNSKARFTPFDELFPLEDSEIPDGKDGWMVFLDEFNAAAKPVQSASYKLILDKMVGQRKLHPNVVLGMAGNLDTDRAITNMISTAMQSRVIHLEMEISFREFMEDVALKFNWDSRIIAYLNQYESKLMDFRPDHNERTFCCPRTWEFTNKLISGRDVKDSTATLLAGTITSGVAVDFVQFCQLWTKLITVRQIVNDPRGTEVPYNNSLKWATIAHMMEKVEEDIFDDLCTYANRFSLDFRILFYRSTMVRHPHLRKHPAFAKAMIELSRYLNG